MNNVTKPYIAVLRTILLVLITVILGACGRLSQAKARGEKAVANFHALYNQGKFEDIWKDADPGFQTPTTKLKYEDLMQAMQRKLGQVLSTSNISWRVQSFNMKTSVLLSQTTTFEHGQGTEAIIFALNGTNAMLVQYNIQSVDMMTK
jgi:hypothetical protein